MNYFTIAVAILTVLVAIIQVVIALVQVSINKYKVKYDLYDKRYKVFELCMELLDRIITDRDLDSDELFSRFVRIKNESYFLFKEYTANQIEAYYTVGFYYRYYKNCQDEEQTKYDQQLLQILNIDNSNKDIKLKDISVSIHEYCYKHFYNLKDTFLEHLDFRKLV